MINIPISVMAPIVLIPLLSCVLGGITTWWIRYPRIVEPWHYDGPVLFWFVVVLLSYLRYIGFIVFT